MIDNSKNLCYIMTTHYLVKNGQGIIKKRSQEFVSMHSINTKKARDFAETIAKEDPQFYSMDEDGSISQRTIKLKHFCK